MFHGSGIQQGERVMTDRSPYHFLLDAVDGYFDLIFDCDVSHFDRVFAPSAQLHGLRDGALRLLPAQELQERARLRAVAEVQERPAPTGNPPR